jgi:hypothetical protein
MAETVEMVETHCPRAVCFFTRTYTACGAVCASQFAHSTALPTPIQSSPQSQLYFVRAHLGRWLLGGAAYWVNFQLPRKNAGLWALWLNLQRRSGATDPGLASARAAAAARPAVPRDRVYAGRGPRALRAALGQGLGRWPCGVG